MLDVVCPISIPNADLFPELLEEIERYADVPTRIIAIIDGGVRSDFAVVESALKGSGIEWMLIHEEKPVYLNACLRLAIEHVRAPFVAFMQPFVRLADSRWFGKMQQIFHKDPVCGVVDTWPNTQSSASYPVKRSVHRPPEEGCPLAMLSGRFFKTTPAPIGVDDPVRHWFRKAHATGGSAWHAGGVSYNLIEHERHHTWRVSSEAPKSSRSQSPTTPASSIPTTTGRAGSEDFTL